MLLYLVDLYGEDTDEGDTNDELTEEESETG